MEVFVSHSVCHDKVFITCLRVDLTVSHMVIYCLPVHPLCVLCVVYNWGSDTSC